jgi:acyl-homoserine-lactone acylase
MTQARLKGTDGQGKPGFTSTLMRRLEFSDIQYGATLAKDTAVAMCKAFPGGLAPTTAGPTVAVGNACTTLQKWNGRENIHARGAVLWRAFWENALNIPSGPWKREFNSDHPLTTPNTLLTNTAVKTAFGDALATMNADDLPFDVELGTVQYVDRNGTHIPLHGGPGDPDGDFNAIYSDVFDPSARGDEPTLGSSYIQVTTWHSKDRCPDAHTILTYSQSANPNSPYYTDQTKLYSKKKWVHEVFCAKAVKAATTSTKHLTGTAG